jgi:alanine dehydrogenase
MANRLHLEKRTMKTLTDAELAHVPMRQLMHAIAAFVVADFQGTTTAPPRHAVDFPEGKLVFTAGGYRNIAGVRIYETFRSALRAGEDQAVLAWNTDTCLLEGAYFGTRLGALRTGALGGLAVDALTSPSIASCAVIGSGTQAETQLLGILACRELNEIRIHSRRMENRERLAKRLREITSARVDTFVDAAEALTGAEIAVLATTAESPVVEADWLRDAKHVTTVGPKFKNAHELPIAALAERILVSDSPQQIRGHHERHMLFAHPRRDEIRHLGESLSAPRAANLPPSLYLSTGLAGTEVVALQAAIAHLKTAGRT